MSRIYILPTRSWLVLGGVMLAMWYAAVSQSNSGAYLLMFFLGSLVLVTAYHAHFALVGLATSIGRIAPVHAGQNIRVPVEVTNLTSRRRFALEIAPDGHVFHEPTHAPVVSVNALASATAELLLPAQPRGRHALERVALTTIYPLGFFRSWRYQDANPIAEYLVYPAPFGNLPMPEGAANTAEISAGGGRGGDDYGGVRGYQLGESQRHVDWRAVARGQPLLVKQFAGAGSRRLWFDYDLLPIVGVEPRLSQLCRWIVEAEKSTVSYGLRVGGFTAPPDRGAQHYHRCLEALALAFPPIDETPARPRRFRV